MQTTGEKPQRSILLVEDEASLRRALARYLRRAGYAVRCASTWAEGHSAFGEGGVDVAFVDFRLPDGNGADLICSALEGGWAQHVYGMTSYTKGPAARAARAAGCMHILEKPFDVGKLSELIEGGEPELASEPAEETFEHWRQRCAGEILGSDERLIEALKQVRNVADTNCIVLIRGESGTGKELFARAVHEASSRASGPFIALNCAAIPESMVEAELFGHARGAFTGAHSNREGRVAAAAGGTLFLDEIGDMPLAAQAKLLRLLSDQTIMPVGSDRPVQIDVRIVAATNQDLEAMVSAGTFRGDLFYRLNVIPLMLPPLRERGEDVVHLAEAFLKVANERNNRSVTGFERSALDVLRSQFWQGNVRELAHLIERMVVLKGSGKLSAGDLKPQGLARGTGGHHVLPDIDGIDLRSALDNYERHIIVEALRSTGGNRTEAAAKLGLNRTTLVQKIRKHNISDPAKGDDGES
ncbi:MAG: acetoacetate metabolism transcriptional regulator AtoC [Haliangiales bacterium]